MSKEGYLQYSRACNLTYMNLGSITKGEYFPIPPTPLSLQFSSSSSVPETEKTTNETANKNLSTEVKKPEKQNSLDETEGKTTTDNHPSEEEAIKPNEIYGNPSAQDFTIVEDENSAVQN
eukprot:TRINITY_DN12464_c0_g1_i1.p1 TRINITY_DN12464_c0_g1~~TRINITY_DN12464_c0_g1_i1.p1  ORF type:complete len:135 (-),score=36.30 TRINITY_DN12464_c0_g1_i1:74-433(-)